MKEINAELLERFVRFGRVSIVWTQNSYGRWFEWAVCNFTGDEVYVGVLKNFGIAGIEWDDIINYDAGKAAFVERGLGKVRPDSLRGQEFPDFENPQNADESGCYLEVFADKSCWLHSNGEDGFWCDISDFLSDAPAEYIESHQALLLRDAGFLE